MARQSKGLTYFPMDVDYYDDDKVFALMDAYGPLGDSVYKNILSLVYRQGYYLEIPIDRLAAQITRRIGSRWIDTIEQIREIILCCGRLGLLCDELLQRGVVTSKAIQKRYSFVLARRRWKHDRYWLLDDVDAETTEVVQEHPEVVQERPEVAQHTPEVAQVRPQKKSKEKEIKENESTVNESTAEESESVLCDDGCASLRSDRLRNAATDFYERQIGVPTPRELMRLDNMCLQYGESRVMTAISEAVAKGARKIAYIEKILATNYPVPPMAMQRGSPIMDGEPPVRAAEPLAPEQPCGAPSITDSTHSRAGEREDLLRLMEDGAYDDLF
ncbi:MAG: DUF4373 domain-containing protein [Ruminococcaceae bacterium]|nr:DUF4373 domain-containing protein [Oscillospiraceae bacterium]